MRIVLACYGSRGDVEPCVAVGRELLGRGHDVRVAVPPDLVRLAERAGVSAVGCGPDLHTAMDVDFVLNFLADFPRNLWNLGDLIREGRETQKLVGKWWGEMSRTLTSLADGADLLFAGPTLWQCAANVAEYYDIPLATLHTFPIQVNGQLVPMVPAPLIRSAMTVLQWLGWPMGKKLENDQRRELGLPNATGPSLRRITERGALEIQAYDEVLFPGLAAEWAKWNGQRPFVGALTIESATEVDDEVASWIAAGTPPIFFSFGSIPLDSAADTLAMIGAACAQLGERALVCSAGTDFSHVAHFEHVKIVDAVDYAAILPACRTVVHHGGAGTVAAGLRAGVPTLILWRWPDQQIWGAAVKRLRVGTLRRFSTTTQQSLVDDLRTILSPQYVGRAREVATRMSKAAESAAAAADYVESFVRLRHVG
ncbi:glycosyltransferase [uncultured Mycobacterium sp.]|uniref:glycosyltransferase n=1 Tax=uncultured Mycobacterium sp. TaxID=171292 RepID=UPI0035C97637